MELPLVTVICLCHNQAAFIREAVESVWQQTYANIQLIVVDDASSDNSAEVIRMIKKERPSIELLLLDHNLGNCKAFNRGLSLAKGRYVIDLAADDILLPERVARGVDTLESAGEPCGVHFTDALLIDEKGVPLHRHSDKIQLKTIPTGNVYESVISHYFVCSPTMMMRKKVLDGLGGYDESLQYEDFDFLIRSSRNYLFAYTDEVLVKQRVRKGSLSERQFRPGSDHWKSTLRVLEKVKELNASPSESRALRNRILYELGFHLKRLSFFPAFNYLRLLF